MKRVMLAIVLLIAIVELVIADEIKFYNSTKYRIESLYDSGSSVAIGSNHSVNSPLCVAASDVSSADCYWYFVEQTNGKYAIRNAMTSQYVTRDDSYSNSPILRYLHLSDQLEGEASMWYIKSEKSDTYGDVFYFQNVGNPNYYFNLRTSSFALGAYYRTSTPSSSNEVFKIYDANGNEVVPNVGPIDPQPNDKSIVLKPINGRIQYLYRADGKIDAIPEEYIEKIDKSSDSIRIATLNGGPLYAYAQYEVDSLSFVAPKLPKFNSFKFNNKFNHHIIEDAPGIFYGDDTIKTTIVGIGKTLRPSFKLDVDVQAYIGDSLQKSKITRVRFADDVVYTLSRRGQTILRQAESGEYYVMPYGREVTVHVDFATDHSKSTYNVPAIYITTDNNKPITSKYTYVLGKIRIDGSGVFPDFPETPMQIKGRGNTSWTSTGKAPYHFKFGTAQPILGLKKGKHWNLIANAQTHSMTTNAIAMKIAQMVETAAFNHEIPVDLYVNNEYRGSYNLTEKIGLANNSVDLDDESNAVLLELDSYYDEAYKFRSTGYSLPVNIKEPDLSEGISELSQELIEMSFNRVTTALYNKEDMKYLVDYDYLARFLFVDELTANFELMHPKSTFCYNVNVLDSSSKYIFGPVWDFDWAYGYQANYDYFNSYSTVNFWLRTSGNGYNWAYAQRYCGDAFDRKYYKLWYDFMHNGCLQELIDFCDDYYQFAAPSFSHDNGVWGRGNAWAYATVTNNAKQWLNERARYVLNYMGNTLGYEAKGYSKDLDAGIDIGDVNGDGAITTADLVCILNYMLNLYNEEFDFAQADADYNNIITINDLIKVRNLIPLKPTKSGRFYSMPEAGAALATGKISYTADGVCIPIIVDVAEGDYCGLQFDLKIPAGMTVDNLEISSSIPDFQLSISPLDALDYADNSVDRYRVSIYSDGSKRFPAGKSNLTLLLGWGDAEKTGGLLRAILADVMFVNCVGEDERAMSPSAEFCAGELTGIDNAVSLVAQKGNKLTLMSEKDGVLPVYGVDGRVYRYCQLSSGTQDITLPSGIYIINRRKIIVH